MRFSLFALALLAFAATAQAQSPSFGLKAGLNVADVYFDTEGIDDEGLVKQPRLGFVGGVTADVPFTEMLGLRAEVLYAQKGFVFAADFEGEAADIDGKLSVDLDYLEVPLLLNIMVPTGSALEVGFQGGIVPAFLINDDTGCSGFEIDVDGQTLDGCEDFEEEDEGEDVDLGIKSFDLGAALGLTVGSGPFAVDLRYTYGLTDLSEEDADNFANNDGANNGVFSITGVYRFGR